MAKPIAANGYEDKSPATQPANRAALGERPARPVATSRRKPDVEVMPQEGVGKGSALSTACLAATGDIIVAMA
jgi:hypothetical protein